MSVHYEAGSPATESLLRAPEAAVSSDRLTLPTEDADLDLNVRSPLASAHGQPPAHEPGTMTFASSTSTRWTRGRGNKSFPRRLGGAAAGVVIAPFVMVGRAVIFGLGDAGKGVRAGASWAAGILKDQNPLLMLLGVPTILIPALLGGAVGGAAYGAVRGFFGAVPDIGKAIASQMSGGNVNYFSLAYRKYRD